MTPEEFDNLAKELHHEWESPQLWPAIETAVRSPRRWRRWAVCAAAGLAAMLAVALYLEPRAPLGKRVLDGKSPLLTEQALAEVSAAEKVYQQSIDRLAKLAEPKLQQPASPLLRSYAEKLTVLDEAIEGLHREMNRNGFNTHLHRQMASLYRDKKQTLEEVLHHD
ncbi:MAG TPA: hypothetical protein VFQ91_11660 [Bryobacteraceae bacterium]|nr:hypothetical protein [Bryobacteraceae bacterium]